MKSTKTLNTPKVTRKHIKSASQIKPLTIDRTLTSRKFQFSFANTPSVTRRGGYVFNQANALFGGTLNTGYRFFAKSISSPIDAFCSSEASGSVHAYSGATTVGLFR